VAATDPNAICGPIAGGPGWGTVDYEDVLAKGDSWLFRSRRDLISFVADRPGHDRRYAIDASKLETELGWRACENFESGLEKTVRWYVNNQAWWRAILARGYRAERVGIFAETGDQNFVVSASF